MPANPKSKDLDDVVDDLVPDHELAEKLKKKLHLATDADKPASTKATENADYDEDDELWDNLPV